MESSRETHSPWKLTGTITSAINPKKYVYKQQEQSVGFDAGFSLYEKEWM